MVQTRSQKLKQETLFKEMSSKEKIAIESLILLSEDVYKNELDNYSDDEIREARKTIARNKCFIELDKYDLPMPELVKYCPYTGSYDFQIRKAIKNKNIELYYALVQYKDNMQRYTEKENYLKNHFNDILNNVSDDEILTHLKKNCVTVLEGYHKKVVDQLTGEYHKKTIKVQNGYYKDGKPKFKTVKVDDLDRPKIKKVSVDDLDRPIMRRVLKPDTNSRVYLEDKKNELVLLRELKDLKNQITVRKEILDITNTELKNLEIEYEDKMLQYKRKYKQ